VDQEDRGKGYEIGKERYLLVEDDELESISIESTHTIDIESFVPRAEIDERYLDSPYYIAPTDTVGQEAFAVIREAMRAKKMVGLAKVVLYRRERLLMLEPLDKGLLATTLRYAYEVRDQTPYFEDIPDLKLPDEMRELAVHILDKKAGHFDPSKFEDRYENALIEMLKQKQAGAPAPAAKPAAEPARVINLMDALRRSVGAERAAAPARGRKAAPAKQAKAAPGGKRRLKRAG
jgi:DNA end-binding protein Ku